MRILVSWLRELVDVSVAITDLAWALHMRGFELASIDPPPALTSGGNEDAVIDFEITANRPDCLSMVGMAREVATLYGKPLRLPVSSKPPHQPLSTGSGASGTVDSLKVLIEDPELCPRYAVALAEVTIGPSPGWLAARLLAAGIRPINNVVDATNYVVIELGHPTHAFDVDRLAGPELRIRRARAGEEVRTLDGQDRALSDDMLVIADAQRPQAIAGVMGGADSEVTNRTRLIAIESAYFQPASVRRTNKRLALSTEASYRFERGADIEAPVVAADRVLAILEKIGAGRRRGECLDVYPSPRKPVRLTLRRQRIARVLGQDVDAAFTGRILDGLGFQPVAVRASDGAEGWLTTVPSWRVDVSREVDLIEEIARHAGYDQLPWSFPALTTPPPPAGAHLERDRIARAALTTAGFSEAMTFSFIERGAALAFADDPDLVPLANPLSEKFTVLRPTLLAGLIESVAHNRHRGRRDVALFEVGNRFRRSAGETRSVAFVWTGTATPEHWSGSQRPIDFFDLKGAVERLCSAFGLTLHFAATRARHLVHGRAATVSIDGREVGTLGQILTSIVSARGLAASDEVYAAELEVDSLNDLMRQRGGLRVVALPRYPSVVRDLSIVVDEALPAAEVRGTIRSAAPDTLIAVAEFDRYTGPGVAEGRVSVSFRLTFRSPERTLTDEEVQRAFEAVVGALGRAHGAVQR